MKLDAEYRMKTRPAVLADAQAIKALHGRSVRGLCRDHYTPEQIEGWLKNSAVAKYRQRLRLHRSFVAEIEGEIIGYVRWNPTTNELCSIFVDPDHARQGIGRALMGVAYDDVRSFGVKDLWLDASLNAVPFYQVEGWQYIEQRMHGSLQCVRMTKRMDIDQKGN